MLRIEPGGDALKSQEVIPQLFGARFSRQSCARVAALPPKLSHEQQ